MLEGPTPPGFMQTIWNDDDRFVNTYWKSVPGKLVYSTFDWGIRDADGYFYILGRTDDVINVAGHRLGTREIEESISGHDNVAEVAVVGVADALKGQVAMAFVVPKDGAALADPKVALQLEGDIMKRVADQLGALARPARVRFVSALPKDAQRQAAAPRDPGHLRAARSGRYHDHRRSVCAAADQAATGGLKSPLENSRVGVTCVTWHNARVLRPFPSHSRIRQSVQPCRGRFLKPASASRREAKVSGI